MAGASARTLARLFRRETGMSFQAWRRQLRLTEALASLAQGATPARAAAAVGYASGPAFGAAFRIGVRHHAGTIAPRQVSALVFPAQAGFQAWHRNSRLRENDG